MELSKRDQDIVQELIIYFIKNEKIDVVSGIFLIDSSHFRRLWESKATQAY